MRCLGGAFLCAKGVFVEFIEKKLDLKVRGVKVSITELEKGMFWVRVGDSPDYIIDDYFYKKELHFIRVDCFGGNYNHEMYARGDWFRLDDRSMMIISKFVRKRIKNTRLRVG